MSLTSEMEKYVTIDRRINVIFWKEDFYSEKEINLKTNYRII